MSLAQELERLAALREQGVLSDAEFEQAKARLLGAPALDEDAIPAGPTEPSLGQSLRRSRGDKWVGGICGGIARLTGVESWVWRLAFAALFMFWGAGLLLYVLLWIFVPQEEELTA